ncbi:hypothetical protein [Rhizobium mesosinicum]|uniref:Uncharacterized protein n=1 Tax=Rhizobium mesosinicum TaxID=335017 RepID=A0ABS7H1M3_9HYPH|nr:hypothetical protein [Rhizobium mesosinicum]MBW9055767.1 hypothetical protein [Rhizobium mesosinicum]
MAIHAAWNVSYGKPGGNFKKNAPPRSSKLVKRRTEDNGAATPLSRLERNIAAAPCGA